MKNQELIPLEDWVLKDELVFKYTPFFYYVTELAKLLKSKPELGHFIPCDEDGVPMKEPTPEFLQKSLYAGAIGWDTYKKAYQEAESRVLWVGEWTYSKENNIVSKPNGKGEILMIEFDDNYGSYLNLVEAGLTFKREI